VILVLAKRQRVLLTTSRKPTQNIRTICKDISYIFPNIVRINRGKLSLEGIAEKALELDVEKVMIIDRWERGMGKIGFFEIKQNGLDGVPPVVYLRNAKFRRDFGEQMPKERIKSVAIATSPKENFEAKKIENVFSGFFGVPVLSVAEAVNDKYDAVMQILMDSLNRIAITFKLLPDLVEIGPQMAISHLVWELTK
jgi:U3 small nucleolar ribonucleoprotein protein IMP4